jgi:hypothetical protein
MSLLVSLLFVANAIYDIVFHDCSHFYHNHVQDASNGQNFKYKLIIYQLTPLCQMANIGTLDLILKTCHVTI